MEYKIFGCKTNKYFTEKWMNDPRVMGKSGIFVSSCIVTQKADKKWKKFILQYLKKNPEEIVFLSGCAPIRKGELRSDFYDAYPELQEYKNRIELLEEDPEENTWTTQMEENTSSHQAKDDFIDGNRIATEIHKESSTNTGKHITKIKTFSQIPELNTQKLSVFKEKFSKIYTRKYLVIQTGCDNYCTFCLTVQARGGHKNRSTESILQEIQEFVEKGGKEVVLTGTNIGAFGASNSNKVEESRFCELIETILEKTSIHRIRISSLWVEFLSDTLFNLLTNKRLHAYVHLSIQSGSDRILKAMNRHYDRPF